MTPDAKNHNATPEYARELFARIGKPQVWVAARIGVGERRIRYVLAGTRDMDGKPVAVSLTYPEQFALEQLAIAAEVMRLT